MRYNPVYHSIKNSKLQQNIFKINICFYVQIEIMCPKSVFFYQNDEISFTCLTLIYLSLAGIHQIFTSVNFRFSTGKICN